MSCYRRLDTSLTIAEDTGGEVYPCRVKRAQQTERAEASHADVEACKHLRKNQPANIALPRTKAWLESLPLKVRPSALMRQFPRIANLLAAAWGDVVLFEACIDSLLTDKRGGRKGFPGAVITELGALDIYRHTVGECTERDAAQTI